MSDGLGSFFPFLSGSCRRCFSLQPECGGARPKVSKCPSLLGNDFGLSFVEEKTCENRNAFQPLPFFLILGIDYNST